MFCAIYTIIERKCSHARHCMCSVRQQGRHRAQSERETVCVCVCVLVWPDAEAGLGLVVGFLRKSPDGKLATSLGKPLIILSICQTSLTSVQTLYMHTDMLSRQAIEEGNKPSDRPSKARDAHEHCLSCACCLRLQTSLLLLEQRQMSAPEIRLTLRRTASQVLVEMRTTPW